MRRPLQEWWCATPWPCLALRMYARPLATCAFLHSSARGTPSVAAPRPPTRYRRQADAQLLLLHRPSRGRGSSAPLQAGAEHHQVALRPSGPQPRLLGDELLVVLVRVVQQAAHRLSGADTGASGCASLPGPKPKRLKGRGRALRLRLAVPREEVVPRCCSKGGRLHGRTSGADLGLFGKRPGAGSSRVRVRLGHPCRL